MRGVNREGVAGGSLEGFHPREGREGDEEEGEGEKGTWRGEEKGKGQGGRCVGPLVLSLSPFHYIYTTTVLFYLSNCTVIPWGGCVLAHIWMCFCAGVVCVLCVCVCAFPRLCLRVLLPGRRQGAAAQQRARHRRRTRARAKSESKERAAGLEGPCMMPPTTSQRERDSSLID